MSRFQWILLSFILLLGLIGGGFLLSLDSLTPVQSAEEGQEGEKEGEHDHSAKGPHGGVLLGEAQQAVKLEVVKSENQGKLQLRFYALQGNQILAPAQAQIQGHWRRLGKNYPLKFVIQEQAWAGTPTVDEPHSFELAARLTVQGKSFDYHWESHEGRLELSAEQLRESKIGFERVVPRTLSETVDLPGKIAVDQDRYVHLTPRVSGIVKTVYTHLGASVSKGQLLAVIESRELGDLRLAFLESNQRYTQTRQRYELELGFFNSSERLIQGLRRGDKIEALHHQLLGYAIGADRQTLITAYTQFRLAESTYLREKNLVVQTATSQAEFQQAEQAFVAARSGYQAAIEEVARLRKLQLLDRKQEMLAQVPGVEVARNQLQALGVGNTGTSTRYELRAPISGTVITKHISTGEALDANANAFEIANLSQVWAEMMIPESRLESLRLGQRVEVISQTGKYRSGGVVSHLGTTVDENSRTSESHAEVLNPDLIWKPGMFVTVQLQANPFQVSRAVKETAIQSLDGENMIFVQDGKALQAVPVELGRRGQDWVEVLDGLEPGMSYATENSFLLKAELEKSSASHSH